MATDPPGRGQLQEREQQLKGEVQLELRDNRVAAVAMPVRVAVVVPSEFYLVLPVPLLHVGHLVSHPLQGGTIYIFGPVWICARAASGCSATGLNM